MNKLEKYRDTLDKSKGNFHSNPALMIDTAFNKGFDAAISLDLPVKFAEWKELNTELVSLTLYKVKDKEGYHSLKSIYLYWVNNVFKPE